MSRIMLCERCLNPIDRTREPFRACGAAVSYAHALPCARPDTGCWDESRRGLSPAAVHHAAAQADHR